jgi:hypothetical protein
MFTVLPEFGNGSGGSTRHLRLVINHDIGPPASHIRRSPIETDRLSMRIGHHTQREQIGKTAAYDREFPSAIVISDMAKDRVDNVRVITHLSARGSNELEKRDLISLYTAPPPQLFGQLAALDARFGTRNTIALWYVDRFNQTSGRNRGFRSQYRRTHIAVMGYRMYEWLAPYLFACSRYAFPRRRCSIEAAHYV